VADAQYDTAAPHRLKRTTNALAITSFACGMTGLALQLPVMLFVISRHSLPGSAWSESLLLSLLPFLAILFGAIGLDQIVAKHQRGQGLAAIGLLIAILQFVPILLFLFSQAT
jgi:threonine/homoserine efflux transporter RhtA